MNDDAQPRPDGPSAQAEAVAAERIDGSTSPADTGLATSLNDSANPTDVPPPPRGNQIMREILRGSTVTTILAIVIAFVVGGILIAVTDPAVQKAMGYFFADPMATLKAVWDAVYGGYEALVRGSLFNSRAKDFAGFIKPLTSTISFAVPLIAAGLGVGLAFRVGLFNIGGRGQMLIASATAALVGFSIQGLPPFAHVLVVLIAGVAGGASWGGIAGMLKARTGAHEVILTIMLNYIALYLVQWMVRTPGLLQKPGSSEPLSMATPKSAQLTPLFSNQFPGLNWGFVIVILATLFVWWLMEHSALGFRLRAVGENPHAARAAGISVPRMYVYAMMFAGGLAGIAGVYQVTYRTTGGFDGYVDAGIGFDAITVALLGRSRAGGVFAAGLLFGALKSGSFTMQASQGIPADIVLVVQSIIVLFIAAPPLVRSIFGLPKSQAEKIAKAQKIAAKKKAVSA